MGAAGAELLPLPLVTLPVKPAPGTRTLAWSLADMPGRYTALPGKDFPFITEKRFGKGRCYYIAGSFGETANEYHPREYRLVLEFLLRKAASAPIEVENAPALLEMVLRKQGKKHLLHLVNYATSSLRPFDAVTTACNIGFRLEKTMQVKKVRSLALNKTLPLRAGRFVLPELREYDLLVMDEG